MKNTSRGHHLILPSMMCADCLPFETCRPQVSYTSGRELRDNEVTNSTSRRANLLSTCAAKQLHLPRTHPRRSGTALYWSCDAPYRNPAGFLHRGASFAGLADTATAGSPGSARKRPQMHTRVSRWERKKKERCFFFIYWERCPRVTTASRLAPRTTPFAPRTRAWWRAALQVATDCPSVWRQSSTSGGVRRRSGRQLAAKRFRKSYTVGPEVRAVRRRA